MRHEIETADQIEVLSLSHHLLYVLLDGGTRQITRFAGYEYDGKQKRGDLWLLPAGLSAFWSWEGTDEVMIFILEPNFLQQIALESNCLNPQEIKLKPIVYAHDPTLAALSLTFRQEMASNEIGGRLYNESLANQCAIHLLRHYCAFQPVFRIEGGGLSHPILMQAIEYIHDHLDEKLKLEAIAEHLNLSVYYFCTLFTQSMGISPYQYVLQQRVERSKHLLKQTQLPFSEIAVMCGFSDQTQMSKHFRKLAGTTPKAYRQAS